MPRVTVHCFLWKSPMGTHGSWSDLDAEALGRHRESLRTIGYAVSPIRRVNFAPLRLTPNAKARLPQSGGTTDAWS